MVSEERRTHGRPEFVPYHQQLGGAELRFRQLPNVVRRTVRHPRWMIETIRGAARRRRGTGSDFALADHLGAFATEAEAIAAVTGASLEEAKAAIGRRPDPTTPTTSAPLFGGRPELLRILDAIVSLHGPGVVVETGVAQGASSLAILEAMERLGKGHLHSIDLPVLSGEDGQFVGRLVPSPLKHRWSLHLGPSRMVLPSLLDELGQIDIFLHDSDHSYETQLEEYRAAWPRLRGRGILLSDDVENPAFLEFAAQMGARPYLVGDAQAGSVLGLVQRRGG